MTEDLSTNSILEKMVLQLERLDRKLSDFIGRQQAPIGGTTSSGVVLDVMYLISLPDHLRKTMLTLMKLGRATAQDVADITHRARAIESHYLNHCVDMGIVEKERRGRKAYFYIDYEQK